MSNTNYKTLLLFLICSAMNTIALQGQCISVDSRPFTENFNGTLDGWSQSKNDDFDWSMKIGKTPSRSTGPSNGKDDSQYAYTEASRNYSNTSTLTSPCFDLTQAESPVLTFDYHMYGSSMGTLKITASSSNNEEPSDEIFIRSGDQGDQWHTGIVELSKYAGSQVTFEISGVTGRGFRSDIAIDNVVIADSEDCTLTGQACQDGDICTTGETYDKNCDCTGGLYTDADEDGICEGQDEDDNNACIPIPNATCNTCDNTISGVLQADFSSDLGFWQQVDADDTDWTRTSGSTPSTQTGPSGSFKGENYLFIESSGRDKGYPYKKASLISDCIDMTSISKPLLFFAYHMSGITMGELNVYVIDMQNDDTQKVFSRSGDQGDQWQTAYVDLRAYQNTVVKIIIEGVTGRGFKSDIAIDDTSISIGSESFTSQQDELVLLGTTEGLKHENRINSISQDITTSEMLIDFSISDQTQARLHIYSQVGQLIESADITLSKDQNMFHYDTSTYTTGAYFMSVTMGKERLTSPILIAN